MQIVALTCTLIASKFLEVKFPCPDDLVEAAHVYVSEAEAAWKAQRQAATQKEAQEASGGGALKPAPAVAAARREARPVCKAAKKLIAKPNPRNQGKLAFKPATKPQAA